MNGNILIVQADPLLCRYTEAGLRFGAFLSQNAQSGLVALEMLAKNHFDAVLLDADPVDENVATLLATLRAQFSVPVIVSFSGPRHDVAAMLDAGADDCLCKPFGPGELLARLRAILRRGHPRSVGSASKRSAADTHDCVRVGRLELYRSEQRALLARRDLQLTDEEFQVLLLLAGRPGELILSRDLVDHLCQDGQTHDDYTLSRLAFRLVSKITLAGGGDHSIEHQGLGWALTWSAHHPYPERSIQQHSNAWRVATAR